MKNVILLSVCYLIILFSITVCTSRTENSAVDSPKFQQYYVQGELLYQKHCSNCHQLSGKGLGKLYPPLDKSDFMENNFKETICIMKYGKLGVLSVNGIDYNMEMKGNPSLTELEVAEIATYIYNTWTHQKGLIDVHEISKVLGTCNN